MRVSGLLLPLILLVGCAQPAKEKSEPPKGPAAKIEYVSLTGSAGQRITVKAWVLGDGESFRSTGDPPAYYHIIGPEPKADWGVLGDAETTCAALVKSLEQGEATGPAGSDLVSKFNTASQAAGTFNAMLKQLENEPTVLAWAVFPRPPVGTRYGLDTDPGIPYLNNPSHKDLLVEAKRVHDRINRLLDSAELEITGTAKSVEQFIKDYGEGGESVKSEIQKKQVIVQVDNFKVLRTGRDLAELAKLTKNAGEVK